MNSHTYYDILGVSRDATSEEITAAKNALAKVYHPDANVHKDIDTTAFMQDILEAYRVLSNPEKRQEYNREIFGESTRVFRTFTVGPEDGEKENASFVTYWNSANQLHEIVQRSIRLMKKEPKQKNLAQRIFLKMGKKQQNEDELRSRRIARLSLQAASHITVLKMAGIPRKYWDQDAMNWLLIRWGQKQTIDYHSLFPKYDDYVEDTKSNTEKLRIKTKNRQFHHNLKKLLSYTLDA